jgi:hypothetical protein
MADEKAAQPQLSPVIARFPAQEALARYLFRTHPTFRSVCEDYCLAAEGLAKFEALPANAPRPEIEEYRNLMRELEAELRSLFSATRRPQGAPDR